MRDVILIQFNSYPEFDYAFVPDLHRWYEVIEMNDVYYVEEEDDDGDTREVEYKSISIRGLPNTGMRQRSVIKDDNLEFTTMTLQIDNDSKLFLRR